MAAKKPHTTQEPKQTPKSRKCKITCYSHALYEPTGCTRTLASFEDGTSALDQQPAVSKALDWLDDLLEATNDFSLHGELKKIREACNKAAVRTGDEYVFRSNADVPLRIVNLILAKYGLTLEDD